jgi:hypothetical protein
LWSSWNAIPDYTSCRVSEQDGKSKTILLLLIAAISAMGQCIDFAITRAYTEKQNPVAGASYVMLHDKIQFSFPDGTSFWFPRYDLFEAQAAVTVRQIGSLWHYDLVITSANTSRQLIRNVTVLFEEGTQFANVTKN